jgi:hypothetical protein
VRKSLMGKLTNVRSLISFPNTLLALELETSKMIEARKISHSTG